MFTEFSLYEQQVYYNMSVKYGIIQKKAIYTKKKEVELVHFDNDRRSRKNQ